MSKLERLRALIQADPSNAFAWYTLAMEQKKSDRAAALQTFADLVARQPSYVPSYYHYAKTLEEAGDVSRAKQIYAAGMQAAKAAGDMHAYGELEGALDLL